ncbi:ATP-dependent helicase HrpB [Glutamicibacter uratoxydans]|uniref:RNA helicase n=1 Tax=Glutamicibacter uratoxydans TaxID=43667 RepID=A0A4Y4DVR7_GLUUR|nr:ATP-dependent helicase HrpB [Glutamicibacter uratoxydans]GED07695.1 ATP-dependent helicase HrpB [Glutamicibacter uratoxydans]
MSFTSFNLESIAAGLAFGPSWEEIAQSLKLDAAQPLVIHAPPGSGKTTVVPPTVANALAEQSLNGRVLVTQPRRVAARAAARRLAQLDGSVLGERVGFSIRGERKVSASTRVEFVTSGLLLRRLLNDPDLDGVSAVIIDEVHERSIDTDLLVAMVNQVSELRDNFSLILMSATLHAQELSQLLVRDQPAPVISADTAQYDVAETFDSFSGQRNTERGLSDEYLQHIAAAAWKHSADINRNSASPVDTLVFLPGVREVQRVCSHLEVLGSLPLALHSQISSVEQDEILSEPEAGTGPRIIVSTSIAESSLTVPRVHLVIDSGYAREPRRDTGRGFSGLVTVVASRAAATQRAGRAGRLGAGQVIRTLDAKSFAAAPAFSTPEIRTGDLVSAGLELAAWGTPRGEGLSMWEAPPDAAMKLDEQVLRSLDAVDDSGRITSLGEKMVQIPTDPRTARALLDGSIHFGVQATAEVVALLASTERVASADLSELLAAVRRSSHPGHRAWKQESRRLAQLAAGMAGSQPTEDSHAAIAGVCALAYPQWLAKKVGEDEYLLASGTRAVLPRGSQLGHSEFLAVAEVSRTGQSAMIRRAAAFDFSLVQELLPQMHQVNESAQLIDGKISARKVESFGLIELSSKPVKVTEALGIKAAQAAVQEHGLALFGAQENFDALRRRLAGAYRVLGEPFIPMDEETLLARADQWLTPVLRALAGGKPAEKIDLHSALRSLLPWEHAHDFDQLVPQRLQVPSGSWINIQYPPAGEAGPAVVAVKLQECFGLQESPRLINNELPVQFHLLSPAGRPLAVTEDLVSFFNGPYAHVRSEMRGRYPKHPWPENPWEHVATKFTKNRLSKES